MAHRIRLRQPWTRRVIEQESSNAVTRIVFERRFNRPTGIEPDDRIEVEVNVDAGVISEVCLNEGQLEVMSERELPFQHARIDLSEQLAEHNVLQVHLHSSESEPELGDVNLWITPKNNS